MHIYHLVLIQCLKAVRPFSQMKQAAIRRVDTLICRILLPADIHNPSVMTATDLLPIAFDFDNTASLLRPFNQKKKKKSKRFILLVYSFDHCIDL